MNTNGSKLGIEMREGEDAQVIAEASICGAAAQSLAAGGREWRSGQGRRWQRRGAQALFEHVNDISNLLSYLSVSIHRWSVHFGFYV